MAFGPVLLLSVASVQQPDSLPRDSVHELRALVVTATRAAPTPVFELPAAVTLVPVRAQDRGAARLASDLLRRATGVQVQQTSAGQGAVILRGLVGNQVLLLVDGVPLNNGTFRDGPGQYLATIDPESVERVEVVRGAASVLYGSDAQGGVVNLITRPHPERAGASLRAALSASAADRGYRARTSAGWSRGPWALAAGASIAGADDLRAGGRVGRQEPTGFQARGAEARVTYRPEPRHELEASLQRHALNDVHRYDRYVTYRAPQPGADVEHRFDPQTRQLAFLRHRFAPAGAAVARLETTVSLAIQREGRFQRRRLDSGQADSVVEYVRDDVRTPGVSLVATSAIGLRGHPVVLTWGGEAYGDALDSRGYVAVLTTGDTTPLTRTAADGSVSTGRFPDGSSAQRFGVFASAETRAGQRLRLSAGVRWSRFRTEAEVGQDFGGRVEGTSADVTGQVGVVLEPAPAWRLALRVAEGFRAPNLYDLTNIGPVPGGVQLPNPAARPERSLGTELSLRRHTGTSDFEVTLYRTAIDDFIDRAPGAFRGDTLYNGERVFQGRNVGTARVIGAEAEAARRIGPVEMRATLLATRGTQRVAGGAAEPMSKIPAVNGLLQVHWASGPVVLDYTLRWAAAQPRLGSRDLLDPRIAPGGTAGYVVHGVRARAALGREATLSLGLENLTDRLYREHASGLDAPGRYLWAGVSWLGDL